MRKIIENTPMLYQLMLIINALLIIASFILPPTGVVDPSVLAAVGELGGLAFLGMMPLMIKIAKGKMDSEEEK